MDILTQLRNALAGRYAVERELGQGGMATVYLAQDERHGRQVAIKVLKPELASALGPDRFLREIRLAAGLQHPHILAVYDSGDAEGLLYYVMPFVEGESLRDRLEREQQLPIEDAVILAREVADALAFAHSHGVVHRDIKPENILISGGHAVVADFGIARALSAAGEEKLTQTGMSIGTPTYMSPEQAMGDESVDGRSDIYSLGCVLYEMLSGQPPFLGPNPMAILARHSMEAVPSLSIVRATIPPELEDIVYRTLAKVPADRYQTAKKLAVALSAPLEATTGAHPRATTGMHARRPRASRRRFAMLGLLLLPVAVGTWLAVRLLGGDGPLPLAGPDPNSIAVLYFEDKTGGDLRHVAEGFTEALIHELSEVPNLQVISSNGVRPYQGSAVSPDSLSRALDVGTLVSGTVSERDDTIEVNVSLISAGSGKELASLPLRQPRRDIAELQDSLSQQVSDFLRGRLGREVSLRERRTRTRSAEAWETLQRAEAEARSADTLLATGDAESAALAFDRADSMMAAAGQRDSRWTAPSVRRAWLAYRRSRIAFGSNSDMVDSWIGRGLEHADRALAIDQADPDALEARGTLRYWRWLLNLEPDSRAARQLHEDAEADLRASVTANPNQAQALSTLSHLLLGASKNAEGKVMAQRAYEADPYLSNADQVLWRLFQASFDLNDAGQARHWCEVGAQRFPENPRFTGCRIQVLALKATPADIAGARRMLDRYVALSPPDQQEIARHMGGMFLAMAFARAGMPDSARAVARRSRASAEVDPTRDLALYESIVRAMIGDRDEAIRQLSTYIASNPRVRELLAEDQSWYFDSLREDAGYKALVSTGT